MALPKLTADQRQEALAKATAARQRRALVKQKLKSRDLSLEDFFTEADADQALGRMRAQAMLESMPRIGVHRANQIMEEVGISKTRRVSGLGRVQREALLGIFGE
ncbi:integration host factor, actinobacterial type [Actinomyces minihominis]|uniref:integration host factor, actinobacterial type n=1 Tax=Actinomyces minihominis TaxID=2002838 RepID=UPI000C0704FF|nr:integration host factor, actinobacterial type [Actinomyces minihominis]